MPLNISNVTSTGLTNQLTSTLLDNNIAAAFGLNSNNDNVLQFLNRFGTNSVFLPDKKTFIIRTVNNFSVEFKFQPISSKVLKLFSLSLMSKNADDLKYFIQEVTLPNIRVPIEQQVVGTGFMQGSIPGHLVIPEARTFDISLLTTEFSLHEHCFYYWLKETVSNKWIYVAEHNDFDSRPFTKADIKISFTSMKTNELLHSIVLTDCFPVTIAVPTINQTLVTESPSRKVSFAFNNIFVSSTFTGIDWTSKLQTNVIEDVFNSYVGNTISNKVSQTTGGLSNSFGNSVAGSLAVRQ
jgi:hypothetical protein